MFRVAPVAKAVVGALVAGLGVLAGVVQAHGGDFGALTVGDLVTVGVAVLTAAGVIHRTPNR